MVNIFFDGMFHQVEIILYDRYFHSLKKCKNKIHDFSERKSAVSIVQAWGKIIKTKTEKISL